MQDTVDTLTVEPPGPLESPGSDSLLPAEAPVFTRGACLGRYIVLEAIGGGGMGTIFKAYDPELDRKVAIKVLHRRFLMSEARRHAEARLLREARVVARLAHPNVVSVYDVGDAGGCVFIAMELIEGQSLASWLQEVACSRRQVMEVFEKAGRGLVAAHAAGLVHRDFKPSNVMLARDGRVLVVDFGIALHRMADSESEGSRRTSPGSSESLNFGTPTFMAPEQRAGRGVDARADQYSFCVSLYQALFGALPPGSQKRNDQKVDSKGAPSIIDKRVRSGGFDVPGGIRQALLRGLSVEPSDRFPSLADLLAEIGEGRLQRRRRLVALLAVVLMTLGLMAALGGSRRDDLCTGAERRLDAVWDTPRQAELQQLLLNSGRPYSKHVWDAVKRSLDNYTQAWQMQYGEACEATHRRGEQSHDMLDRRMACLDERLLEVREVTNLLLLGETDVLAKSIETVDSLGRLATCRDRTALLGLPTPLTGEARQQQLGIQTKLAKARALEAAGRFPQVVEEARAALAEAEALENQPLSGEAYYWLAMGVGRLGQFAELRDNLMRASGVALATKDYDLLARSLIRLVITGSLRGDQADAREWDQLAGAVIKGLAGRVDLEARRLQSLCFVAVQGRQYEQAAEHCHAALDTDPKMPPQQRAIALNNLGNSLVALGRVDEAIGTYDESLALIEKLYGDQHPNYAGTLTNLGRLRKDRGELEEAQDLLQRALEISERSYGPESRRLLPELAGLANVLMKRGQVQAALPYLQRAVDLEPTDPAQFAIVRFDLAAALWATEQHPGWALDLAGKAVETFTSLGEPYETDAAEARAWLEQRR